MIGIQPGRGTGRMRVIESLDGNPVEPAGRRLPVEGDSPLGEQAQVGETVVVVVSGEHRGRRSFIETGCDRRVVEFAALVAQEPDALRVAGQQIQVAVLVVIDQRHVKGPRRLRLRNR